MDVRCSPRNLRTGSVGLRESGAAGSYCLDKRLMLILCCCCLRVRMLTQGMQSPPGRMTEADSTAQQAFAACYDTAELYYAYHLIHTTANQPFKTVDDATLFNAARCAANCMCTECLDAQYRQILQSRQNTEELHARYWSCHWPRTGSCVCTCAGSC